MKTVQTIDPFVDPRWDDFVGKHPFGWLCHLSTWKTILEESFSHMKGYYLATISRDDAITSALPVFEVRSWLTGRRLVSVPFATLCDPLIQNPDEFDHLANAVIELGGQLGAGSFVCRTFHAAERISDGRFRELCPYKHHFMSLERPEEEILNSFDRTCVRQRLRRAWNSRLCLEVVENETQLADFYRLYVITRKHLGLPPQPFEFIRSLWNNFSPSGNVEILMAGLDGRQVAGILLLKYRDRVSVEYSVHDERYRNLSPVHFLFWEAMRRSRASGYRIFDLGRTSRSNTSLMNFKKRWGMQEVDLHEFQFSNGRTAGNQDHAETPGYSVVRNICRHTPSAWLPAIGKLCYRHLG